MNHFQVIGLEMHKMTLVLMKRLASVLTAKLGSVLLLALVAMLALMSIQVSGLLLETTLAERALESQAPVP